MFYFTSDQNRRKGDLKNTQYVVMLQLSAVTGTQQAFQLGSFSEAWQSEKCEHQNKRWKDLTTHGSALQPLCYANSTCFKSQPSTADRQN